MALPQVKGDMRPSLLLTKMRALTPPGELERLEQSGVSSAELVFGTPPTFPGQFLSTPKLPPT